MALVAAAAFVIGVAGLAVQILGQIIGARPRQNAEESRGKDPAQPQERHQKRRSSENVAPPGTAATRARDSELIGVFKTNNVTPVAAKTPPTPSRTRAVV